jgi:hypothetical protein
MYSPEVQAMLDEEAKKEAKQNFPQLHPVKIRLVGKNPNKPNVEEAGKFYSQEWSEFDKKYLEKMPFGVEPFNQFSGIVLDVSYRADWKFREGQTTTLKTREFHDWKGQIELLKFEYGEKTKVSTAKVFQSYADFKAAFAGIDEMTGIEKQSPYDLIACIYLYQPTIKALCKYEVKGMTRSSFWDYQRDWQKAISETKTMKNVITIFGVEEGEKGFAGTFKPSGLAPEETMIEVVKVLKELRAWQEGWETSRKAIESVASDLPVIDALADVGLIPRQDEDEIDVSSIPF